MMIMMMRRFFNPLDGLRDPNTSGEELKLTATRERSGQKGRRAAEGVRTVGDSFRLFLWRSLRLLLLLSKAFSFVFQLAVFIDVFR